MAIQPRWLLAGLLILSGCGGGDPAALRDWTEAARIAVAYRPAAETFAPERERDAPIRRVRPRIGFGLAPAGAPAEPPPPPESHAARRAAQADAVLALQSVAATWLEALNRLAAGTPLPPREGAFAAERGRVARADAAAAAQVAALEAVLAAPERGNPRAGATLRRLVEQGNAPFQAVLGALRDQASALAAGDDEEREGIILQSERLARQARRTGERQQAQDARDAQLAGQSTRGAARQAYIGIVERIMDTHRMLRANLDALDSAETGQALRRAEASLRRAALALPR